MKSLLRDAAVFLLLFMIIFFITDRWTFDPSDTSSTWKYIQQKEQEPIDILFMGNSHAFCGINPTILTQSTGLNAMILGASSQPMDQTFENLKVLLHYVRPKVIVLESNTLVTTTEKLFDEGSEGLLYDNFDGIRNPLYRAGAIVHTIRQYSKWPEAFSQLLRPTNTWTRFHDHSTDPENMEKTVNFTLGYHPRHNIQQYSEKEPREVEQSLQDAKATIGPLSYPDSEDALRGFLALAERENIPVYIIKTPVLYDKNELPAVANIVEELALSDSAVKGYRNFSEHMTEIGMEQDDFSDGGHLNREGANKFTVCLIEWLSGELGFSYDLSKVTGIRKESFQRLTTGKYRYTVSLFDNTEIRFITKDGRGNITSETDYSDVNYIDIKRISSSNKLYYRIRSKTEIPGRQYPFELIEYPYMHDEGVLSDFTWNDLKVTRSGNTFRFINTYTQNKVEYAWYVKKDKDNIYKVLYPDGSDTFEFEFLEPGKYTVLSYIRLAGRPSESKSEQAVTILIDEEGTLTYTIP